MGSSAKNTRKQGTLLSGVRFVSIDDLMEKVHACLVPTERDFLLDCLDEMQRRCDSRMGGRRQVLAFNERGAIEALLKVLDVFRLDEVLLRQATKTLVSLCGRDGAIVDRFLDMGGRDALAELLQMHREDPFISEDGARLVGIVRSHGKTVAQREATRVINAYRFCLSCRALADSPCRLAPSRDDCSVSAKAPRRLPRRRNKGPHVPGSKPVATGKEKQANNDDDNDDDVLDPVTADLKRVERILDLIECFSGVLEVIEICVDALIAIGKSGATQAILDAKCVFKLVEALKAFPTARSLQWKGLLAIMYLAKKDPICADLGKAGVVPLLAAMWARWEDDEMRQLVLWALNEVARTEPNQLRMASERIGAMLRTEMESVSVAGAQSKRKMDQAGLHYCIPLKLRRLYRQRRLGSLLARKGEETAIMGKQKVDPKLPPPRKGMPRRVGDDWATGESGLI